MDNNSAAKTDTSIIRVENELDIHPHTDHSLMNVTPSAEKCNKHKVTSENLIRLIAQNDHN
jgi:hypothetical protein